MKSTVAMLALACAVALPSTQAAAQELDVTRRAYTFLDNRLTVAVLADAPGTLQVLRGERGRIEVAARSSNGFAGFGLGGGPTRQLRLTAVGSESVQYLVVVPEGVSVRVQLPAGNSVSLASRQPAATYTWQGAADRAEGAAATPPVPTAGDLLATTWSGLHVVHRATWAPRVIDVPELGSVRSISVRFEGGEFRVAASRPLAVQAGSRDHLALRVDGAPLDLVIYVPRGQAAFTLRSGDVRIAESVGDRPRAICQNVVIHNPTQAQTWLTFYPQLGQLDCR
jgi:hypothetical protein